VRVNEEEEEEEEAIVTSRVLSDPSFHTPPR